MKHSALAVLAISAMLTGTGNAQPSETGLPPALIVADSGTSVRVAGLVATWYPPTTGRRGPAILALGGSEGGEAGSKYLARQLNKHGYGVLALAYFQADGLPQLVQELPLEYFDRAIAWMKSQPQVDPSSMGIYGISVGAETALVVAARHPELKAVVAGVPSSVVWQGINPSDWAHPRSSFATASGPLPYLPYDNSAAFFSILDLYQRSLNTLDRYPDAIIPVEHIGGDVLLISARDDKLWPSTPMADQIMKRLDRAHFPYSHQHLAYSNAGHGAATPPNGSGQFKGADNLGGTPEGNAAARADMWSRVLAFFDRSLGSPV